MGSLGKNGRRNCSGIVGFAVAAFLTDYVEVNFSSVVTIIAQNPNLSGLIILRHDSLFDLLVYSLPCFGHVHHRFGAYGTTVFVTFYHLGVTFTVHRVPTFHYGSIFQRVEKVLVTNGAVVLH